MKIEISMAPDYPATVASLSAMGRDVAAACSAGLGKGVKRAAVRVITDYLSGQSLKPRSHFLARAVDGWLSHPFEGVVGVRPASAVEKYKWLLGDEVKTIVPVKAKFLTIPIGENLTAAGVPRYTSPRQVAGGFFVATKGRLLFGYKRGKRGKFRPLFVLVKSVIVQGSEALYDGVYDSLDDITAEMQSAVDKEIA